MGPYQYIDSVSGPPRCVGPLTAEAARRIANTEALRRREAFEAKHPDIKIEAHRRSSGVIRFYVREPRTAGPVIWLDLTMMMDDLEARFPDE